MSSMSTDDSSGSDVSVVDVGDKKRFRWTAKSVLAFEFTVKRKIKYNVVPDWIAVFQSFKRKHPNATTRILVAKLMKMQQGNNQLYDRINSTSNQTKILKCLVKEESLENRLAAIRQKLYDRIEECKRGSLCKRRRVSEGHSADCQHKSFSDMSTSSVNPAAVPSLMDCVKDVEKRIGKLNDDSLLNLNEFFDKPDNRALYMSRNHIGKAILVEKFTKRTA